MEFRIADTFTDSLARLTGDEQRAIKTTAFDLQLNPANPGMSLHRLDKARDRNFWSVRVSSDIRLIVHKSDASFLLCYVDHHDRDRSFLTTCGSMGIRESGRSRAKFPESDRGPASNASFSKTRHAAEIGYVRASSFAASRRGPCSTTLVHNRSATIHRALG